MDKTPNCIRRYESEYPENDEDNSNGFEHRREVKKYEQTVYPSFKKVQKEFD